MKKLHYLIPMKFKSQAFFHHRHKLRPKCTILSLFRRELCGICYHGLRRCFFIQFVRLWFKRGKLDASLILSSFPYPTINQHCIVQILFKVACLEFTVLLVHFMNYCVVIVISAARFENTWPAHSANFKNGIKTGYDMNYMLINTTTMLKEKKVSR